MSEKYFKLFLEIAAAVAVVLPLILIKIRMRIVFLQKLVRLNITKRQHWSGNDIFYSSSVLNRCCVRLFFSFNSEARAALAFLCGGRINKAVIFLQRQYPQEALMLNAHINAKQVYASIIKQKKKWYTSLDYAYFLALLAHVCGDGKTFASAFEKSQKPRSKRINSDSAAYWSYLSAVAYLAEGDMLSASQCASAALKYFQKIKYSYEAASCYLLLAEIYRISCVNDVAETMLNEALRIQREQNIPGFEAKTTTILGMLMVFENRFAEASELYQKAENMPIDNQLKADISNQKSLLYIAQNDWKNAQSALRSAQKFAPKSANPLSAALNLQLCAHLSFQKKHYSACIKQARQAASIYEKNANPSAYMECMYLSATALCRQQKYTAGESVLRHLLNLDKTCRHNFHIANVYNLLGLIYLQTGDLQRAKVLFQQSLYLEQSNRRCPGLAADYSNLALISEMNGNADEAAHNWELALEYAEKTDDGELIELLKKRYNKKS